MMLRILLIFSLYFFYYSAWGQDSVNQHAQPVMIKDLPSTIKAEQPLYIIKADNRTCNVPASGRFSNSRQVKRAFKEFNSDSVQSIDIMKGNEATDKYGTLGAYGIVIINMKDGTYDALPRKLKKRCG